MRESLWTPYKSVGEAIEILHEILPVTVDTPFEFIDDGEVRPVSLDRLLSVLTNNEKSDLIIALFNLYEHFGHRTDGQDKPCLVCDGNPLGYD